jgi:hypothetical protein
MSFSEDPREKEIFLIYAHPRKYMRQGKREHYHFLGEIFDQIADEEKTTEFRTVDNTTYGPGSTMENTADYKEDGFSGEFIGSHRGRFRVVYLPDCGGKWSELVREWHELDSEIGGRESPKEKIALLRRRQQETLGRLLDLIKQLETLVKPGGCVFFGKFITRGLSVAVQEADDTLVDCTHKIDRLSSWQKGKLGPTLLFRQEGRRGACCRVPG